MADTISKNDLTTGPILKKLIVFFLPIAAGTLFQQLYNAVDALVVGKYVGTGALAAVGGSPAQIINLIIGFCVALCSGAAVVIAQLYGGRDFQRSSVAIQTSYVFSAILGLAVGILVIAFTPQILTVLKTPADTLEAAIRYQRIYFTGSVFLLTFNMGSSILRAVGDSRFPFLCLCVGCVLNISLDILFVIAFQMGVAGVAWATVIAQGVSAVLVTVKLLRTPEDYRLTLSGLRLNRLLLRRMMHIGIPSGLQSSMYGFSNMILQIGINLLGTVVVASWTMSGKIDGAYWAVSGAFGTAITTFIGQNYGAGNIDRIRECAKKGMLLFLGMTVGMSGLIMLAAKPLLHLFTDDGAVISTTYTIFLFFVPLYVLWSAIEVYSGVLRGVGDTVIPSIIIGVGICLFRILWVLTVFRTVHTLSSICLCYPISWGITDIAIYIYYRKRSIVAKA